VALVHGKLSSGTGFLAAPNVVATNAHVIEDEFLQNVQVRFPSAADPDKGPYKVRLLYENHKRDLALLAVKTTIAPLPLASLYTFRRGQDVTTIGNPGIGGALTLENAVSRGVMSTRTIIDGQAFYQLSIAINPGNSGGPVLDSTGQVIAIATLKAAQEEGLAFGIPVDDVTRAVAQASSQTDAEADRAASAHRFALVLRLLCISGDLYSAGLEQYCRAMSTAVAEQTSVDQSLKEVSRVVISKLRDLDQSVFTDLQTEIFSVTADRFVPADTRQALMEMWTNISEMKRYLANPPSDYQNFLAQTLQMRTNHRNYVDKMKSVVDRSLASRLEPATRTTLDLDPLLPIVPHGPSPAAKASPPALTMTVVDISFDTERKGGLVKFRGKLKNTSPGQIEAAIATIRVRDKRGAVRLTRQVHLVPATIEPGEEGTFFTRIPIFTPQDHYKVDFATRAGLAITTVNPAQH
jgi:hypothetical protein